MEPPRNTISEVRVLRAIKPNPAQTAIMRKGKAIAAENVGKIEAARSIAASSYT